MSNIDNRLSKLEKNAMPTTEKGPLVLFIQADETQAECLVRSGYAADDDRHTIFVSFVDAAI